MYQKIRVSILTFSMIMFPLTFYYLSPYLSIMGASEGIITGSIIVFLSLFLTSIFLGRLYCSWLCPAGAIQDNLIPSRSKRVNVKILQWVKFLIWVPWIITILFMLRRAGGIKEVNFFYQTEMGISITRPEASLLFGVIVVIFYSLSLIFGRRFSCHTICWMSPFMILGKKLGDILRIPSFKLVRNPKKCTFCKSCVEVCPMSLEVENLAKSSELSDHNCILCGKCADICPNNVISISYR